LFDEPSEFGAELGEALAIMLDFTRNLQVLPGQW
jgi:hypothetical protein